MTVENLELRVANAEDKVDKCKKTIERHELQLEKKVNSQADEYDINKKHRDIESSKRKLKKAEEILKNWKNKLNIEIEKDKYLEGQAPKVIKEFLEEWKRMAYEWHVKRYNDYLNYEKELEEAKETAQLEYIKNAPEYKDRLDENGELTCELSLITYIPNREMKKYLKDKNLDWLSIKLKKTEFAGKKVLIMCGYRNEPERLAWLEKELEKEKKEKMLDLINRITSVIGSITNADDLRVSKKGNLDGIIIGTEGKAKVETVGAGGWNIQCFHYRTLIHKI